MLVLVLLFVVVVVVVAAAVVVVVVVVVGCLFVCLLFVVRPFVCSWLLGIVHGFFLLIWGTVCHS